MRLFAVLLAFFVCAGLCEAQESSERRDSPSGLVIFKLKRERRQDQFDVSQTATSPDALDNTGMLPTSKNKAQTFVYYYSVEVRNDLQKKVRWLSWIYVVSDSKTKQELDRQEFVSYEKVSPSQRKTLHGWRRFSLMQPEEKRKKNDPPFEERVEFVCVAYEDGSLWHRPSTPESHCADVEKRGKSH